MAVPECLADRYEVRGLLGRGGMGDVYDGWDRRLERQVAIKILNSDLAAQADIRIRFEHEARAAAMLVNSKVVGVYDTGEHEGTPFIVMERLPGRTLADELQSGPLAQERVRAILLDVLEALAAAHDAGIIHRDIKPSNVLITTSGSTKVADFGIAKSTNQNLTQTGMMVGTAAYLSPERIMGVEASPQSDLYSAGVLAFEALSGSTPFQADNTLGLVRAITDDPMPSITSLVPGVEPDLASAIDKATQKLPEDRYASARAMAAALRPARGPAAGAPSTGPAAGAPVAPASAPAASAPAPTTAAGPTRTLPETAATGTIAERSPAMSRNRKRVLIGAALLVLALLLIQLTSGDDPGPPVAQPDVNTSPAAPSPAEEAEAGSIPVSGVATVEFLGPGTLTITMGRGESLNIDARDDLLPLITSEVAGGKLTLGFRPGSQPAGVGNVVYRLGLEELRTLQGSGSGSIQIEGLSEPSLTVNGIGSVDTVASGTVGELELDLSGSGNFDGSGLSVGKASVEISGSGDAELAVSDSLSAELSGSGTLEYTGDPVVTENAFGSGKVKKAKK